MSLVPPMRRGMGTGRNAQPLLGQQALHSRPWCGHTRTCPAPCLLEPLWPPLFSTVCPITQSRPLACIPCCGSPSTAPKPKTQIFASTCPKSSALCIATFSPGLLWYQPLLLAGTGRAVIQDRITYFPACKRQREGDKHWESQGTVYSIVC